jgi:tRNA threonylcarbamoyladenosine biosynthesis protein TsaE
MPKSSLNPPKESALIPLPLEKDTEHLAQQLAMALKALFEKNPSTCVHIDLVGDLGAGKTTLTRYLLNSLGHIGKVKSPTYALCEPYEISIHGALISVHHFDLYRMTYPKEWIDAGFRDAFSQPGICLVEWPEKAEGTLSATDLTIQMDADFAHSAQEHGNRSAKLLSWSDVGHQLLNLIKLS